MALSAEALAERRTGIGGSDIAAIMGVSPFLSALDVFRLKKDLVEVPESEAMYWGSALEGAILDRYQADHPEVAVERNFELVRGRQPADWTIGTPDAFARSLGETYGVEIKTTNAFAAQHWDDGVPLHYQYQCQWYMFVCELERWDLAVLIGGSDYREFALARDNALIQDTLLPAASHFWQNYVLLDVPPPPSPSDKLADLYPDDNGAMLAANFETEGIVLAYRDTVAKARAVGADVAALKAQVQGIIGENSGIEGPWGRITWKRSGKSRSRRFLATFTETEA